MKSRPIILTGCFGILLGLLFSQTSPGQAPAFRFLHDNQDAPKNKHILAELKKWTVQPSPAQQKDILKSMLSGEVRPPFFRTAAQHLNAGMDKETRQAYNAKIKTLLDEENYKTQALDEDASNEDLSSNETPEDPATSTYAFRCLDLDGDQRIDLLVFNQVYFGPSPGLVFYGWNGSAYTYLFDCSGAIGQLERIGDKLYFRFVVTIIDPPEAEILASITYDFKTKTCALESKLYYAQKTQLPKSFNQPQPFALESAAVLRTDPKKNDTPLKTNADGISDYETTRTLYGNAVAELPPATRGFVLARDGHWAFVACSTKVLPTRHSLHHGMEPTIPDPKNQDPAPLYLPCQYFCGWIKSNR